VDEEGHERPNKEEGEERMAHGVGGNTPPQMFMLPVLFGESPGLLQMANEGERLAFKHLQRTKNGTDVVWVNADGEQGWPFDIVIGVSSVEDLRAFAGRWEELIAARPDIEFVEVKTSACESEKPHFKVSAQEFKTMQLCARSYSISHVSLENSTQHGEITRNGAKIRRIANPHEAFMNGWLGMVLYDAQ